MEIVLFGARNCKVDRLGLCGSIFEAVGVSGEEALGVKCAGSCLPLWIQHYIGYLQEIGVRGYHQTVIISANLWFERGGTTWFDQFGNGVGST